MEKLNESLNRPGTRLAGLTLLGHLIRKQPPWVHHISRSALLLSLLRCLKVLVLVLVQRLILVLLLILILLLVVVLILILVLVLVLSVMSVV